MKFVKQFIILILALVSIVLVVALFVSNDFKVTRTVEIERERSDVFDYLRYLENHENFTVWSQIDPDIKQTYSGPDGNVGSIYTWDSKLEEVGSGEQEITDLIVGRSIEYELRFKKPWESIAKASFLLNKTTGTSTKVIWSFNGNMSWPWNITLLFMDMDNELGPDLEKGLENLKNILEVEE
jgi:hypothetical protein